MAKTRPGKPQDMLDKSYDLLAYVGIHVMI